MVPSPRSGDQVATSRAVRHPPRGNGSLPPEGEGRVGGPPVPAHRGDSLPCWLIRRANGRACSAGASWALGCGRRLRFVPPTPPLPLRGGGRAFLARSLGVTAADASRCALAFGSRLCPDLM